jgi:fibronectin type 3 domain-containing protein
MAPGLIPYQPQNLTAEQTDGKILLTWSGSLAATSYQIQRSLDGVNFTNLAVSTGNQYVDMFPSVTVGVQYYYQVAGVNINGTSVYSSIVSMVAAPPSEMSLGELRLRCQQTADRVGSQFVINSEWNEFIRIAMYELYDILMTSYEIKS